MNKLIAVLVLGTALSAHAAPTLFGRIDCGSWVNKPNDTYKSWLSGYLSGLNSMWATGDPLGQVTNAEQYFVWMDNYCRANPLEMVATGAQKLYMELVNKLPPVK